MGTGRPTSLLLMCVVLSAIPATAQTRTWLGRFTRHMVFPETRPPTVLPTASAGTFQYSDNSLSGMVTIQIPDVTPLAIPEPPPLGGYETWRFTTPLRDALFRFQGSFKASSRYSSTGLRVRVSGGFEDVQGCITPPEIVKSDVKDQDNVLVEFTALCNVMGTKRYTPNEFGMPLVVSLRIYFFDGDRESLSSYLLLQSFYQYSEVSPTLGHAPASMQPKAASDTNFVNDVGKGQQSVP